MQTFSQLTWASAGYPVPNRGRQIGLAMRCAICGGWDEHPLQLSSVCPKTTFSGHQDMQWPSSEACCRACSWAMEGRPPSTLRMWTLVYREDGLVGPSVEGAPDLGKLVQVTTRVNLTHLGRLLRSPADTCWGVAVANSGKVHVVPYVPLNLGGRDWSVRLDREIIRGCASSFCKMSSAVAGLLSAGFRKSDILTRRPSPAALAKNGIEYWKKHISVLPPVGGTALERLTLLVVTKDNVHEWQRSRT